MKRQSNKPLSLSEIRKKDAQVREKQLEAWIEFNEEKVVPKIWKSGRKAGSVRTQSPPAPTKKRSPVRADDPNSGWVTGIEEEAWDGDIEGALAMSGSPNGPANKPSRSSSASAGSRASSPEASRPAPRRDMVGIQRLSPESRRAMMPTFKKADMKKRCALKEASGKMVCRTADTEKLLGKMQEYRRAEGSAGKRSPRIDTREKEKFYDQKWMAGRFLLKPGKVEPVRWRDWKDWARRRGTDLGLEKRPPRDHKMMRKANTDGVHPDAKREAYRAENRLDRSPRKTIPYKNTGDWFDSADWTPTKRVTTPKKTTPTSAQKKKLSAAKALASKKAREWEKLEKSVREMPYNKQKIDPKKVKKLGKEHKFKEGQKLNQRQVATLRIRADKTSLKKRIVPNPKGKPRPNTAPTSGKKGMLARLKDLAVSRKSVTKKQIEKAESDLAKATATGSPTKVKAANAALLALLKAKKKPKGEVLRPLNKRVTQYEIDKAKARLAQANSKGSPTKIKAAKADLRSLVSETANTVIWPEGYEVDSKGRLVSKKIKWSSGFALQRSDPLFVPPSVLEGKTDYKQSLTAEQVKELNLKDEHYQRALKEWKGELERRDAPETVDRKPVAKHTWKAKNLIDPWRTDTNYPEWNRTVKSIIRTMEKKSILMTDAEFAKEIAQHEYNLRIWNLALQKDMLDKVRKKKPFMRKALRDRITAPLPQSKKVGERAKSERAKVTLKVDKLLSFHKSQNRPLRSGKLPTTKYKDPAFFQEYVDDAGYAYRRPAMKTATSRMKHKMLSDGTRVDYVRDPSRPVWAQPAEYVRDGLRYRYVLDVPIKRRMVKFEGGAKGMAYKLFTTPASHYERGIVLRSWQDTKGNSDDVQIASTKDLKDTPPLDINDIVPSLPVDRSTMPPFLVITAEDVLSAYRNTYQNGLWNRHIATGTWTTLAGNAHENLGMVFECSDVVRRYAYDARIDLTEVEPKGRDITMNDVYSHQMTGINAISEDSRRVLWFFIEKIREDKSIGEMEQNLRIVHYIRTQLAPSEYLLGHDERMAAREVKAILEALEDEHKMYSTQVVYNGKISVDLRAAYAEKLDSVVGVLKDWKPEDKAKRAKLFERLQKIEELPADIVKSKPRKRTVTNVGLKGASLRRIQGAVRGSKRYKDFIDAKAKADKRKGMPARRIQKAFKVFRNTDKYKTLKRNNKKEWKMYDIAEARKLLRAAETKTLTSMAKSRNLKLPVKLSGKRYGPEYRPKAQIRSGYLFPEEPTVPWSVTPPAKPKAKATPKPKSKAKPKKEKKKSSKSKK